jgi:hypothetical protein
MQARRDILWSRGQWSIEDKDDVVGMGVGGIDPHTMLALWRHQGP